MSTITYIELEPYGALNRAIAALDSDRPADERIAAARAILSETVLRSLVAGVTDTIDVLAIVPADVDQEARENLANVLRDDEEVELRVRGRVVGAMRLGQPKERINADAA